MAADRHKPHKMVRVPLDVYEQLRLLAERRARLISHELRQVLIKELETEKLWPPATTPQKPGRKQKGETP